MALNSLYTSTMMFVLRFTSPSKSLPVPPPSNAWFRLATFGSLRNPTDSRGHGRRNALHALHASDGSPLPPRFVGLKAWGGGQRGKTTVFLDLFGKLREAWRNSEKDLEKAVQLTCLACHESFLRTSPTGVPSAFSLCFDTPVRISVWRFPIASISTGRSISEAKTAEKRGKNARFFADGETSW